MIKIETVAFSREFYCCIISSNPYITFGGAKRYSWAVCFSQACTEFARIGCANFHTFDMMQWLQQTSSVVQLNSTKMKYPRVSEVVLSSLRELSRKVFMPIKILFWAMVWHGMRVSGHRTTIN